jgi:plastocyanin
MLNSLNLSGTRALASLLALLMGAAFVSAADPATHARPSNAAMLGSAMLPFSSMSIPSANPAMHMAMPFLLHTERMRQAMAARQSAPYGLVMPYGSYPMYPSYPAYGGSMQAYMRGYPSYGQGYGQGYGQRYGNGGMGSTGGYQRYSSSQRQPAEDTDLSRLLKASGVPTSNGGVDWPVGLRSMAEPGADELRGQIDALLQRAVSQAVSGAVNPGLIEEINQGVDRLRKLLHHDEDTRFGLPLAVYRESDRFLSKLKRAGKRLQAGWTAPGEADQLKTDASYAPPAPNQAGGVEVGLYDNYIKPATLTVAVGATVRWSNQGQHRHTVTADDDQWGSPELSPKHTYTYTFARRGRYAYHCTVHSREMRGTIIVK